MSDAPLAGLRAAYSKAYYLRQLRAFSGWERIARAPDAARSESDLGPDEVVLIHDDDSVTLGLFRGEHLLVAGDDEDWKKFCHDELGFRVPPELRDR